MQTMNPNTSEFLLVFKDLQQLVNDGRPTEYKCITRCSTNGCNFYATCKANRVCRLHNIELMPLQQLQPNHGGRFQGVDYKYNLYTQIAQNSNGEVIGHVYPDDSDYVFNPYLRAIDIGVCTRLHYPIHPNVEIRYDIVDCPYDTLLIQELYPDAETQNHTRIQNIVKPSVTTKKTCVSRKNTKNVHVYNIDGTFSRSYSSTREASKGISETHSPISQAYVSLICSGAKKQRGDILLSYEYKLSFY